GAITVSGSVDTNTVGSYTLTYDVVDTADNAAISVTRTITVTDQTAPVITLNGDASLSMTVGNPYVETGASASDNNDGDLSADIVIGGSVDTSSIGSYLLSYDVSDSAGNAATTVTRSVEILDTDWDGDGIGDSTDPDDDNDGVEDSDDAFPYDESEWEDTDGDGIGNNADTDDDNDGVADSEDAFPLDENESVDTDGDGIGNNADTDDDNDGVADDEDAFPLDETEWQDSDGDGIGDNSDDSPYPYSGDINFELTDYLVAENGFSVEVKVTRTNGDYQELTVDYAMQDGRDSDSSATATNDYEFAADTLTFADGETEQNIMVNIVDDSTYEGDESFTINLSNLQSVGESSLGSLLTARITIQEDDAVPPAGEIGFEFDTELVDENDGEVSIKVVRTGGSYSEVSVSLATLDDTAVATSDYTALSQTLTFADGEIEKTATINLVNDELYEFDESFRVALSNLTGDANLGTSNSTVTILDDDPVPPSGVLQIENGSYQVNENDDSFEVTVVRSGGSFGEVSVDVVSQNDSAIAGEDYQSVNQTLTFTDGETAKTITVSLIDDSTYEGNETFTLQLVNSTGTELSSQMLSTVIIAEDDAVPPAGVIQFSGAIYSIGEAEGSLAVTLTRTHGSFGEVTVDLSVVSGTATYGIDYRIAESQFTFLEGEISHTVSILIFDDSEYEGEENFTLQLTNLNGDASLGSVNEAMITIGENDPVPSSGNIQFSGNAFSISESFNELMVTVLRTSGSYGEISVDYAFIDGAAVNGEDFNGTNGTLYFADGETSQTLTIGIVDDSVDENNESFSVELRNAVNTTIAGGTTATVTINDNDETVEEEQSSSAGGGSFGIGILVLGLIGCYRRYKTGTP
ncbi:MAG: DUF5011 domain-containing protein, partial [Kangiellaceae bacterium]|nr:DUF5011 domain-containing protein [Kangiellaceae bacterium]